jgi:hypothetical protein
MEVIVLPLRKPVRQLQRYEGYRGAIIFLTLSLVCTGRNYYRFDWAYASETYRFFTAALDSMPGIYRSESPYCERDPVDNKWKDKVTLDACLLKYDNIEETSDLTDYLSTVMLEFPDRVDDVCPECGIALTGSSDSLRYLESADCESSPGSEPRHRRVRTRERTREHRQAEV